MKNVGNSSRGRSQEVSKNFMAPMYGAHCAVIFAIAQLSCSHWTKTTVKTHSSSLNATRSARNLGFFDEHLSHSDQKEREA